MALCADACALRYNLFTVLYVEKPAQEFHKSSFKQLIIAIVPPSLVLENEHLALSVAFLVREWRPSAWSTFIVALGPAVITWKGPGRVV